MKQLRNAFRDTMSLGIMSLSALVVFSVSYAMLGAHLHHHAAFGAHPDCPICEIEDIFSSGDKTAIYAIPVPDFRYVSLDSEDLIRIPLVVTPADSTRAPPF